MLGVEPETAEADTEGIEHHVSERTLAAFSRFLSGNRDGSHEDEPGAVR